MIVHVDLPRNYKKPKVRVFRNSELMKLKEFLIELKNSNKVFTLYLRNRGISSRSGKKEIYTVVHY